MRFERVVDIDATADKVWRVLVDMTRWPEWTASVRSIEPLDGDEPRPGKPDDIGHSLAERIAFRRQLTAS